MRIFTASYTAQASSTYEHQLVKALAGSSKSDMLIAGGNDTYQAEKFNGTSWSSAGSLPVALNVVVSHSGLTTNDCVTISTATDGTARYDGTSWTVIDNPPGGGHGNGSCGPPDNLVHLADSYWIYTYDGTSWTSFRAPCSNINKNATGNASRFTFVGINTLILRYDGVSFTAFPTPMRYHYDGTTIDTDSMLILKSHNGSALVSKEVSFIDDRCVVGCSSAPVLPTQVGGGLGSFMLKNGFDTYTGDVTVALFYAPDIVSGNTYYVDVENGNDSNDGLSVATAWATLTKAADTVDVGDRVIIAPGVYRETIVFSKRSSRDNPIVFEGDVAGRYFGRQGVVRITNLTDDLSPPDTLSASCFKAETGLTLRRVHIENLAVTLGSTIHIYDVPAPYEEEQFSVMHFEDVTVFPWFTTNYGGFVEGRRLVAPADSGIWTCSDIKGGGATTSPNHRYFKGLSLRRVQFIHFTNTDNYMKSGQITLRAVDRSELIGNDLYGFFYYADSSSVTLLPRNYRELQIYDLKTLWALALNFHHSVYKGEANDTWPEDIFGIPRYRKMPGCFAPKVYSLDFDVYRSEPPSVKFEGGGHYTFLLPFRGGSTVTVWVKFAGTDKPRLRVWGPVLGELYVDAVGDGTDWEELLLQVNTNDVCLVSFIFPTYSDTAVAYFSDFDVLKVGA